MGYMPTQLQLEKMQAEEALERKQWTPKKFLIQLTEYCDYYDFDIIEGLTEFAKEYELSMNFISEDLMSDKLYSLIQEDAENKRLITKTKRITFRNDD